ncbi:hypothetical protein ACFFJY_09340 [Fictibacillus aquaticus]|uniref:Phage tail protein n=1 Tax=Fictibacillus aquaticus TaxID=2021314 RepID=A0A235FC11_9BACL|nr:hypothetical protein [Fictibacillus aquaticus]OYD58477.1 hypothetical protein CGZ90_00830 [Fictibacillus aquaticus]
MPEVSKIPFGLADITIGEGADIIKFDGKENLQAEGGEVSISPILEEMKIADFGDSTYDEYVNGYEGEVKIIAAKPTIKLMQLAMSYADAITDTTTSEVVGLMDSKIGTSMRDRAKKITIHPRVMGTDKSLDINLYKMAAVGELTRAYENAQGNLEITLKLYPRDGFDANKPGNFFYIGPKDPNVVTP